MKSLPRILLIGTGSFGSKHLCVLKELESDHKIILAGVVVRDEKKRNKIVSEFGVATFSELTVDLLRSVDAVDVVTPPETHLSIVSSILPHTNVFVEKPLATNEKDALTLEDLAKEYKRHLIVGHIFRFNPVTKKLKTLFEGKDMPKKINGVFINPLSTDLEREPSLEMLHLFDVIDLLWNKKPASVYAREKGRVSIVDARYEKNNDAHFMLGWRGDEKKRMLSFVYDNHTITADFISNIITSTHGTKQKIYDCSSKEDILREELVAFIKTLKGDGNDSVDGITASRIVGIAGRGIPKKTRIPRVAVIGGGIFGSSIAAELGTFAEVTLFEKNPELMMEGSHINQFRHHYGYHYPRSDETVIDIKCSRADFERVFAKSIIDTYPTYYGLAKKDSLVTAEEFLLFCKKHELPYKESYPDESLLQKELMDLCVLVPEPSYHYEKLKSIAVSRLNDLKNITVIYNATVTSCAMNSEGVKTITFIENDAALKEKEFDIVVNATYANINCLATWLDFENCSIRIDLAEVLIVNIPIEPISMTVIDGPFATLMPTGNPNEFTLYHVNESIIDRYVPKNGRIKKLSKITSNKDAIFRESLKLFPILKDAVIVESRIVHRGVQANHEHDDSRVAELIDHGFGCWSILSGKILSSVSIAKRLAEIVSSKSL